MKNKNRVVFSDIAMKSKDIQLDVKRVKGRDMRSFRKQGAKSGSSQWSTSIQKFEKV